MNAIPAIYIDGDACSVISETEKLAKQYGVACHIFCDTTRTLQSDYSTIHTVDRGPDAVDFAILNACSQGDIIITVDGGLAALALSKQCHAVSPYGEFNGKNIQGILTRRYIRAHATKTASGKKRNRNASIMRACGRNESRQTEPYAQMLSRLLEQVTTQET